MKALVLQWGLAAALLTACSDSEPAAAGVGSGESAGVPSVLVVNHPLETFATRIGGEQVQVEFPAPADGDPAFWSPDAEIVARYQQADLVLLNGAGYAKWVERTTLPASRLIDTSRSFADQFIKTEGGVTHIHGPEGEHAHEGTAFTTWLDPTQAVEQARAVLSALEKLRPQQAEEFRSRFAELERELMALDLRLAAIVAQDPERPLLGSHPVYQYLQRRYDLNLKSVHWEPDQLPDDQMWQDLEQLLSQHPARCMLWEGAPLEETAARLKTLGIDSVTFAPAGNQPAQGDFLSVMKENADELERAFR